jgi:flagellar biosynthesis/type III secretory pathway protein FliH
MLGKAEGKAEGRAEGIIETGYDFGLTDKEIIERLKIKLNISLQQAQSYLKVYKNKIE